MKATGLPDGVLIATDDVLTGVRVKRAPERGSRRRNAGARKVARTWTSTVLGTEHL